MADASSKPGPGQTPFATRQATHGRREAYYSGQVQGVGFRYTVRHLAGGFEVAGFVRNLPDGRVHLIAEGATDELTNFLAAIDQRMAGHVRDVAIDSRPATGEFTDFEIRH